MTPFVRASAAAIALLCASLSQAAIVEPVGKNTTVALRRGSSNITSAMLGDACAKVKCTLPLPILVTVANCPDLKTMMYTADGLTRTTGGNVYQCVVADQSMVTFKPNPPPPACPDKPADEQQQQTCPAGTVGTWLQDKVWTLQPAPTCWVLGDWTPAEPPVGMCAPADSDGDGVPDSADQCPTVHASTPNGCPATPPELLPAPTNPRAAGTSTSTISVTWDAVAGAAAYSLERCIGATCMTFSQLICVTGTSGTHSSLPANLTARYRIRASRDAVCGTATGNLGEYGAIVSGTTLGGTPEPTSTVSLSWTPSTRNIDGTALTNLAGHRINYGRSAGELTQTIQIANPGVSAYSVTGLDAGAWFFAVRAYTSTGVESDLSNIAQRTVP